MIPKKRPRMPQSACFAGNPPYAAHSFKHEDNVAKMVRWAAYYLYRDRLGFRAGPRDLDALDIKGVGLSKDDPTFGVTEVFHDKIAVSLPSNGGEENSTLTVTYHGWRLDFGPREAQSSIEAATPRSILR